MDIPKYEPVAYLLAVKSLEDESEERGETGPRDEAEMCEIIAVSPDCRRYNRFAVGQIVFVEPCAYHCATRLDDALFVREECVLAVATEE